MNAYTEDNLVQKTTAEYLVNSLGWNEGVYAMQEVFGAEGTLGRTDEGEVLLVRYLRPALERLNPGLPAGVYDDAIRILSDTSVSESLDAINREKYKLLLDGIPVRYTAADGTKKKVFLRVFDFANPAANHFLCVRELWLRGSLGRRRRADVVGFVNGVPLVFMELKNVTKDIFIAYRDNFCDYRKVVPQIFHFNAFVILANGIDAKIGTHSAKFKFFHAWKRLSEDEPGAVDMETLLKGTCSKANLLDLFENFIVYDESAGSVAKILARNHQFLGVNRAVESVRNRRGTDGKLGVFWHTQGSGKSYSMVYFMRKVHRKLGGNFTFLVLTDRDELDTQIYKTFAGCGIVDNDKDECRAASGAHLKALLGQHKSHVFSLIQKFNEEVRPGEAYTTRDDVIVISDEAHRSQYGLLALNMRNALPNAGYIGFTGTPLFKGDELTKQVFGDYVSKYDFQRAVDDGATVPLYYDARGEKLSVATQDINEKIAEKLAAFEAEGVDVAEKLESELKRDYHVITASKRLDQIARDFVRHYAASWENGKAMFVCIDKLTCVKMYDLIRKYWKEETKAVEAKLYAAEDEQEEQFLRRQLAWMRETIAAVIVSEEQNEDEKFAKWGLDILPHRKVMKEGFDVRRETIDVPARMPVDEAFKAEDHPFRIAIVCAMWLTGFDVPSLGTLYLDKPLKAHTLMQAIARANRVNEGKNNGLIVDYCGILKNLRQALATFAGGSSADGGGADGGEDPVKPEDDLLRELDEAIRLVREWLADKGAPLAAIVDGEGFAKNAAINAAKEAANENDETRKRFDVLCRTVFSKFKACITFAGVNRYRAEYAAIRVIYMSLQQGKEDADISDIMRELQAVVDEAIMPRESVGEGHEPYDISRIDFERLRQEFAVSRSKRTAVQSIKATVEKKLAAMLARNPLRADFQRRYEGIVAAYNSEKDRQTIEQTFEALLKFIEELSGEEERAVREGLDEESLAIYDLLKKPALSKAETGKVKAVAKSLLDKLKAEKLAVDHWREKQTTRDGVRKAIFDYLFSETTGLPSAYSEGEIGERTDAVYRHVYEVYPIVPSPYYGRKSA
ncbi:MAG: type I restriction endonuclease subunit R [Kiritimatiellae bacterium]|nr:type I restriction endonuclease subunit R [Kiritimatiellia bacterium]